MTCRHFGVIICLCLTVMGCARSPSGGSLDFDIENFVTMAPENFRILGTVPAGLGFTGDAVFHLRVLLPNDEIITDQTYALREVTRQSGPDTGGRQITFALRPRDEAAFHLQQSALLSSLVAGFVNLQSDKTSIGICRASTTQPIAGKVTLVWRDSGRQLTIAGITIPAQNLMDDGTGGPETCDL